MDIAAHLSDPKALKDFVAFPTNLPAHSWLYTNDLGPISLSILCRYTIMPSQELSEEEADARDTALEEAGYQCLLCRDQIEDIIANLQIQVAKPTLEEIEVAIIYFIENDAFIQK